MVLMAKPKPKDRHLNKPLQLRLHSSLRIELEKMADEELTTMTALATQAIRKLLVEAGRWPPKKE